MGASKRSGGVQAQRKSLQAQPQPPQQQQPDTSEAGKGKPRRVCLLKQLRKTKFCLYHLQGICQYGDSCAFAHNCDEMQSAPDLRKTRLCKAFAAGKCDSLRCGFAHGAEELRSTDMFYKKTLCIWHEKGRCRNGDQCRFAHGIKEIRKNGVEQAEIATPDMYPKWDPKLLPGRNGAPAAGGGEPAVPKAAAFKAAEPMFVQPSGLAMPKLPPQTPEAQALPPKGIPAVQQQLRSLAKATGSPTDEQLVSTVSKVLERHLNGQLNGVHLNGQAAMQQQAVQQQAQWQLAPQTSVCDMLGPVISRALESSQQQLNGFAIASHRPQDGEGDLHDLMSLSANLKELSKQLSVFENQMRQHVAMPAEPEGLPLQDLTKFSGVPLPDYYHMDYPAPHFTLPGGAGTMNTVNYAPIQHVGA